MCQNLNQQFIIVSLHMIINGFWIHSEYNLGVEVCMHLIWLSGKMNRPFVSIYITSTKKKAWICMPDNICPPLAARVVRQRSAKSVECSDVFCFVSPYSNEPMILDWWPLFRSQSVRTMLKISMAFKRRMTQMGLTVYASSCLILSVVAYRTRNSNNLDNIFGSFHTKFTAPLPPLCYLTFARSKR